MSVNRCLKRGIFTFERQLLDYLIGEIAFIPCNSEQGEESFDTNKKVNQEHTDMFTSRYAGKRRLLSLATAVALVSPGVTLAQDEADESATDELEEIVVTGTRLQKSSFEQTTPNIVVDAEYIAQGGFVNAAEAINSLPLITPTGTSLAESSGRN